MKTWSHEATANHPPSKKRSKNKEVRLRSTIVRGSFVAKPLHRNLPRQVSCNWHVALKATRMIGWLLKCDLDKNDSNINRISLVMISKIAHGMQKCCFFQRPEARARIVLTMFGPLLNREFGDRLDAIFINARSGQIALRPLLLAKWNIHQL